MRTVLDRIFEDFDGSGDHGQNVVEVVRDATGELTDGCHLLRLPDLGFVGLYLLKTFDHRLGVAPLFDFLLKCRIGLLKLVACRHTRIRGSISSIAAVIPTEISAKKPLVRPSMS